jgi:cytochrome c1
MRGLSGRFAVLSVLIGALAILGGCTGGQIAESYTPETGGNANRGAQLIDQYRCGACHTIPGIHDARGRVGPPLMFFGDRTYIGGEVPNTPANLVRWIRSPQSIESGTAMPNLGLTEQQARVVAAYLYTLR